VIAARGAPLCEAEANSLWLRPVEEECRGGLNHVPTSSSGSFREDVLGKPLGAIATITLLDNFEPELRPHAHDKAWVLRRGGPADRSC